VPDEDDDILNTECECEGDEYSAP